MSFNVIKAVKKFISSCLWSWTHNPYSSYPAVAAPTADTAAFATSEARPCNKALEPFQKSMGGIRASSSKYIKIIKFHHLPLTACPYKQPDELDSNSSAPESFQRFCWRSQIIQVADAFCPVLWLILTNQIYFTIIYIRMSFRLD